MNLKINGQVYPNFLSYGHSGVCWLETQELSISAYVLITKIQN